MFQIKMYLMEILNVHSLLNVTRLYTENNEIRYREGCFFLPHSFHYFFIIAKHKLDSTCEQ